MKKIWKTILILLLIVFLFLLWLFIIRAKQSNELKSWLLREDSNWIIQQVVWGWNDLSINVNWPQTVLRIPISSVVPETLTRESFKFELNLYDENWNKLDYIIDGIERWEGGWVTSWIVIPFFKDSILWMKEFKMPVWAISRINEDTFQVELEDFDWYADMAWDDIWYKIFGKWKIDSVYLEIFHWNNVKLEFAIINEILDEPVVGEDYIPVEERTKALKVNPWERANKENVYNREWLKTLDTWLWVYPYWKFSSKNRDNLIFFESESEDWTISRYAIYDRENHKRLFDCFDGWGGGYIQVDESVDIDTVDVNSCKEKFEEVKEYLNNVIIEKDNLAIENEQYKFYNRESSEKDLIYITVNISNLSQDQKYLAENFKMKTNDSGWKIQILNVWKEPVDRNTFKPFGDVSEEYIAKLPEWEKEEYLCRIPWKDNKNLYLESCDYSVSKKELPWYTMFGTLWIQAVDWYIWYSDWYLVSFPYKFPVDVKTFVEGGIRDKVQNNWLQYHHYIWSDKNYFYTWEDYDTIVIKRIPKSWDFKVLGTGEYWKYVYDKETWFEDVSNKFSYDEIEDWDYIMGNRYPPVYKSWNYLYIAPWYGWEYDYWIRRFPVDMETLKDEEFRNFHPIYEYDTTYRVISDKNYYYQIIENENWYRIFQRIKK